MQTAKDMHLSYGYVPDKLEKPKTLILHQPIESLRASFLPPSRTYYASPSEKSKLDNFMLTTGKTIQDEWGNDWELVSYELFEASTHSDCYHSGVMVAYYKRNRTSSFTERCRALLSRLACSLGM